DPASAKKLHLNDLRRIVRALEVYELTGRPMSQWQTQWGEEASCKLAPQEDRCLCIELPRDELYRRIDARVLQMIDNGLVEEVRRLRQLDRPLSREAAQALGYKELFAHLDGTVPLDEAIREIQTRSRNFAKRQLTWFRHLSGCKMVSVPLTRQLWSHRMKRGD